MKKKKIIVIKIGSSILMSHCGKPDESRIAHIADQIASMKEKGFEAVLVVSGAVACGHKYVDFSKDPQYLKQVAAGIGQAILTTTFTNIFNQKNLPIAQLLLTKENLSISKQKIEKLLKFYIQSNFIPLINENDVLELNSFGGNDYLAAEIASMLNVDRLLILSTYEKSLFGVGGGETKQEVMKLMKNKNIKIDILDGKNQDIILNTLL